MTMYCDCKECGGDSDEICLNVLADERVKIEKQIQCLKLFCIFSPVFLFIIWFIILTIKEGKLL